MLSSKREERERRERDLLCRPNAATAYNMASKNSQELLSLNPPTPILEESG